MGRTVPLPPPEFYALQRCRKADRARAALTGDTVDREAAWICSAEGGETFLEWLARMEAEVLLERSDDRNYFRPDPPPAPPPREARDTGPR